MDKKLKDKLVVVRGAGDLASGVIYVLHEAGYKIIALECSKPSSIRRTVSFSEAVYENHTIIEGVSCVLAHSKEEAKSFSDNHQISILIDEDASSLNFIKPDILVDAILAKKNLGTNINMAKKVIALGPGFTAGIDCHYVIETMRGHSLGRIYKEGSAIPNTGIPGLIASHAEDRVIHSEVAGIIHNKKNISNVVYKEDVIATIETSINGDVKEVNVKASIDGVLRGLIRDNFYISKVGYKIADIDPRIAEKQNCFTISDKARALGGATLLAINM